MEIWDIYNDCFQRTGKVHERGKPLASGDYHLVVAAYPINSAKQILIQKRNPNLKLMPGMWAATGGSAIAGETAWEACRREVKEEIGLTVTEENTEMIAVFKRRDNFNTIWLVHTEVKAKDLVLQEEEVSEAKWVSLSELRAMAREGTFHNYRYLDWMIDYISNYA